MTLGAPQIPMGFVTIVGGIARTGGEYGITWSLDLALVLWWIALGESGPDAQAAESVEDRKSVV